MYTCELTTSPPLVSRHELKVLSGRRVVHLEPRHSSQHRSDSSSCCLSKNVSSACLDLCRSDHDGQLEAVRGCEAELGAVYSCVGDREDLADCCYRSGVPGECAGPCSGQISYKLASQCHDFSLAILSCLKTGLPWAAPGSPQAVSASPRDDTSISVSWLADLPSLHLVHHYNINLTFIS